MRSSDMDLLKQALQNVGRTFGGNTRILLNAIVKEFDRLERYEESQANKARHQRFVEAQKEFKATGQWPKGYGDNTDDIPF